MRGNCLYYIAVKAYSACPWKDGH